MIAINKERQDHQADWQSNFVTMLSEIQQRLRQAFRHLDAEAPDFRNTVAVDERLKKVASALGFPVKDYREAELFFCAIARDANLEPWELDRLLYHFTDHFLASVGYSQPKRAMRQCR